MKTNFPEQNTHINKILRITTQAFGIEFQDRTKVDPNPLQSESKDTSPFFC